MAIAKVLQPYTAFNIKSKLPLAVACLVRLLSKDKSFVSSLVVLILASKPLATVSAKVMVLYGGFSFPTQAPKVAAVACNG